MSSIHRGRLTSDDSIRFRKRVILGTCLSCSCVALLTLLLVLMSSSTPTSVDGGPNGNAEAFSTGTGSGNQGSQALPQTDDLNGTSNVNSSHGESADDGATASETSEALARSEQPAQFEPRGETPRDSTETESKSPGIRRPRVEAKGFVIASIEDETQATRRRASSGALDQFGNPRGDDAGLAEKGEFRGKDILIWFASSAISSPMMTGNRETSIATALRDIGFSVTVKVGAPYPLDEMRRADQLWLVCGITPILSDEEYDAIQKFANRGNGLYVVADNSPYLTEANELAGRMFNTSVTGNYRGDQITAIGRMSPSKQYKYGASFVNPPHVLLTGINFLYEGSTISHIEPSKHLQVVLTASDKTILCAVAKSSRLNVVFDCGFTRYFSQYIQKTAGTVRYVQNIAAYLMGKR